MGRAPNLKKKQKNNFWTSLDIKLLLFFFWLQIGTFLVRDSSDARYLYALSLQTDKGPTSVRIHYSSSGFRLDASNTGMADHLPRFRTVLDLVDHYVAKWSQCRDKGQVYRLVYILLLLFCWPIFPIWWISLVETFWQCVSLIFVLFFYYFEKKKPVLVGQ